MKELDDKVIKERKNTLGLKELALSELPYDKSVEMIKERNEVFKKYMFFNNLRKAIRKANNNENKSKYN